jgi:hypothetical protein
MCRLLMGQRDKSGPVGRGGLWVITLNHGRMICRPVDLSHSSEDSGKRSEVKTGE